MDYELTATIFKALGDPKRVQIMDILSCGEQCACDILAYFDFTQPTLSHHMKVLMQAGLVQSRKSGTWHHYSLNKEKMSELSAILETLLQNQRDCICHEMEEKNEACANQSKEKVTR